MTSKIEAALEMSLNEGITRIGEILIVKKEGEFILTHHADARANQPLPTLANPHDAQITAIYDQSGEYRPLKSAPNLKRGWSLRLRTISELREALDFFYPAMSGIWLAHRENRLTPVHFRTTAARQSGMYDIVKKISNTQADDLAGDFCKSCNCLKTILWKIDSDTPLTKLPPDKFDPAAGQLDAPGKSIPLLCHEACNLLVAAARTVVRKPGSNA
ncbi:MAG: DR2241 family protein [Chthoniobacteraceae bacterium]